MAESISTNENSHKKLKTTESECIFHEFLELQKGFLPQLKSVLSVIKNANISSKNSLVFLKIVDANVRSQVNFTEAVCSVKEHYVSPTNPRPVAVSFEGFFEVGFEVLNAFIQGKKHENQSHHDALVKLLKFLMYADKDLSSLYEHGVDSCKTKWALVLVQHLFSKLSTSDKLLYDEKLAFSLYPEYCPCAKQEDLVSFAEDLSFGNLKGWHGSVDLMIGDVPVSINYEESAEESKSSDSSSDDASTSNSKLEDHNSQIIAQTITNGFLKRHRLRPLIGIGLTEIVFNLYDCQLDVLLQSPPMEFKLGKEVDWKVIIMLWMCLNYDLFSSGVPQKYCEYKSSFHQFVDPAEYVINTVSPLPLSFSVPKSPQPEWWQTNQLPLDKE